jgi:hypothetical protein
MKPRQPKECPVWPAVPRSSTCSTSPSRTSTHGTTWGTASNCPSGSPTTRTARARGSWPAVAEAGIAYQVARVWKGADRTFERRIHNRKHSAQLCPLCAGDSALGRAKVRGAKAGAP